MAPWSRILSNFTQIAQLCKQEKLEDIQEVIRSVNRRWTA
jgi:hypothetical protein